MVAWTYSLVNSARPINVDLSASALVYEVINQLVTIKKIPYKELCQMFDLILVGFDEVVDNNQLEQAPGIYATSDEYTIFVREEDLPASRENMYFSKPIQLDKNSEKIYVSHQWSKWLNDDGGKRAKGYLFFCIESFISICSKLGFDIKTNPAK
ncbi:MAG: hypothetical protein FWH55_09875 [Oscillospiraceae bacterium]|nr:hypothetical protein [Oscillospiraceae bacterium]